MAIPNHFLVFVTFIIYTQASPLNNTFTQENYFMQDRKEQVPGPITNMVINFFGKDAMSELLKQKPVEEPIKEVEKELDESKAENPFLSLFSRQFTKRDVNSEDAAFKSEAKVEKREVKDEVQKIVSEDPNREKRQIQNGAANLLNPLGDVQIIIGTFQAMSKSLDAQSIPSIGNQEGFGDIMKKFSSMNIPGLSG